MIGVLEKRCSQRYRKVIERVRRSTFGKVRWVFASERARACASRGNPARTGSRF